MLLAIVYRSVLKTLRVSVLIFIALTFAGFLGEWSWVLDIANHFRPFYFVALLGLAVLLLPFQAYQAIIAALVGILVNAGLLMPLYWPKPEAAPANSPRFKVVSVNVWASRGNCAKLVPYLRREQPDVIGVAESSTPCDTILRKSGLLQVYSHQAYHRWADLALYSRWPITDIQSRMARPRHGAVLQARVLSPQGALMAFVLHPSLPLSEALAGYQSVTFEALGEYLTEGSGLPAVVMGDFNTTPWSWPYQHWIWPLPIKNTRLGLGILPTWPDRPGLPGPFLPIDHILVSPSFSVVSLAVGPNVGSDHRPLQAVLAWPSDFEDSATPD